MDIYSGIPGSSAGKESAYNVGVLGSISGLGKTPGEGKGCPLHYSGLENSMDCSPWGCKESDTTEWLSHIVESVWNSFLWFSMISAMPKCCVYN